MSVVTMLSPGKYEVSLSALTDTGDNKGTIFAVPYRPGGQDEARTVTWEFIANGAPTALTLQLQGATENVEASFTVLDETIDVLASFMRTIGPVIVRFLRARQVTRTSGTDVTVRITVS